MSTHEVAPTGRIAAGALLIVALYLAGIAIGRAEEESGTFNFLWENDVIAGTDHHYTNGVELSYLSIEDHLWDWFRSGSRLLPGVGEDDHLRVGLALGQTIFTPDDTVATQPLPEQRPYAAGCISALQLWRTTTTSSIPGCSTSVSSGLLQRASRRRTAFTTGSAVRM